MARQFVAALVPQDMKLKGWSLVAQTHNALLKRLKRFTEHTKNI
jgi:hypothetical protein